MVICKDNDGMLSISPSTKIHPLSRQRIQELNNNAFFCNASMNKFGKELVYYLTNFNYYDLNNPEPIDLNKNSLNKILTTLKVIDNFVKKPLEKYTCEDINKFMTGYIDGGIKPNVRFRTKFEPNVLRGYIREFKRLFKIYRQYVLNKSRETEILKKRLKSIKSPKKKKENQKLLKTEIMQLVGKEFDPLKFEWGINLRAPRIMRKNYEKYPDLTVEQIIQFAQNLVKKEYTVRTLVSINLMGRKCEISQLKHSDIDFRKDDEVWIELPNIKKHSSEKVPVELFTFTKRALLSYLKDNRFKDEDLIFPSKETAFAKNIKKNSLNIFRKKITPKTLRKLGVCVAEQLGYSRADVERIGGWSANSPVLEHYFKRKGVAVKKSVDNKIENKLHSDVIIEIDRVKSENRKVRSQNRKMSKRIQDLEKKFAYHWKLKSLGMAQT